MDLIEDSFLDTNDDACVIVSLVDASVCCGGTFHCRMHTNLARSLVTRPFFETRKRFKIQRRKKKLHKRFHSIFRDDLGVPSYLFHDGQMKSTQKIEFF